jgi:hypothetical protein
MTAASRRWRWVGLIVLLFVTTAGCNPFLLPAFMMNDTVKPEHQIAKDNKEAKVLILTYGALETRNDLIGADRELTTLLAQRLAEGCKQNNERVSVVSNSKLQHFKDEHPNWKSLNVEEIGKYFEADYVIDLEIEQLTLYAPGSYNQFFQGQAQITVSLIDLSKPGEEPAMRKEYDCEYPRSRGLVPVSDTNPQKFRMDFLTRVATDISWFFTAHPVEDHYPCD